jgi:predicted GTPase
MPEVDEASGFSILYANIFVENRSYDALETVVREYDADVMALVEFGRHHRYALESLF